MSSKSKILEKIRTKERIKKVEVFGEMVNVKLFTIEEMKNYSIEEDNAKVAEFLSKQFLDSETGEKIFTPAVILNKISQGDAMKLLRIFMKAQGTSDDFEEEIEKN